MFPEAEADRKIIFRRSSREKASRSAFAWLVNEDELDKLYLNLRGETVFTDEGLEIGFVDLKL